MTRKWHLYDAVTHEKNNVMKICINQEESLILIFLLLAHAQTFDRCVVVVVRTRPRAIPLAMITMRKSTHGFPLLSRDKYEAPLGGPSGHRSSANGNNNNGGRLTKNLC